MSIDVEDFILIVCAMVGGTILQGLRRRDPDLVVAEPGDQLFTGPSAERFQKSIRWAYYSFHFALLTIFLLAALIDLDRYLSTFILIYVVVFALSLLLSALSMGAGFVMFRNAQYSSRFIGMGAMLVLPTFEVYAALTVLYILLEFLHHTLNLF